MSVIVYKQQSNPLVNRSAQTKKDVKLKKKWEKVENVVDSNKMYLVCTVVNLISFFFVFPCRFFGSLFLRLFLAYFFSSPTILVILLILIEFNNFPPFHQNQMYLWLIDRNSWIASCHIQRGKYIYLLSDSRKYCRLCVICRTLFLTPPSFLM